MVDGHDERLDDLYQALSSTTRRRIVSMLAQSPRNISELVPAFDMTLAGVSKHVKLLERAGIVHCEARGRVHVCRLVPDALSQAYAWLQGYEQFWQARLEAFAEVLAEDAEHYQGEHYQGEHGQGEHGQGEHGQGEHGQGEHGQGEREQAKHDEGEP